MGQGIVHGCAAPLCGWPAGRVMRLSSMHGLPETSRVVQTSFEHRLRNVGTQQVKSGSALGTPTSLLCSLPPAAGPLAMPVSSGACRNGQHDCRYLLPRAAHRPPLSPVRLPPASRCTPRAAALQPSQQLSNQFQALQLAEGRGAPGARSSKKAARAAEHR